MLGSPFYDRGRNWIKAVSKYNQTLAPLINAREEFENRLLQNAPKLNLA